MPTRKFLSASSTLNQALPALTAAEGTQVRPVSPCSGCVYLHQQSNGSVPFSDLARPTCLTAKVLRTKSGSFIPLLNIESLSYYERIRIQFPADILIRFMWLG